MQPTLDKLISEAKDLANSGERQEALSLANELIEHYPREARVWSLRAYIYGLTANYEAVFADLSPLASDISLSRVGCIVVMERSSRSPQD
jgi:uncharacterized protein HemY